jgi:hypothetical protein
VGQLLLSQAARPSQLKNSKPDVASNVIEVIGVQVGADMAADRLANKATRRRI